MEIYFRISFNGWDVTDKVMGQDYHTVTWTRTTDDADSDRTFNTTGINACYQDQAHTRLLLVQNVQQNRYDFGANFKTYRLARFTVAVLIPMGTGENKTISITFNFV